MSSVFARLASIPTALAGMALLAAGALVSYRDAQASPWLLAAPLFLLALNLAAALRVHASLRRSAGLFVFHAALLGMLVLAGVGRLTHLDGRVEVAEGRAFSASEVDLAEKGPLHTNRLDRVFFVQGPFSVDYEPGLNRARTRSRILAPDADGRPEPVTVGDIEPLVAHGYRFSPTSNKGFAPLLTWTPEHGASMTGTVNMPSYPLYDWNQENRWTPPGGTAIRLRLVPDRPLDKEAAWTLDSRTTRAALQVVSDSGRFLLRPGETARLPHGNLRYEELRGWMGYRVFYDPTLPWMFWVAVGGVAGLAWHVGLKAGLFRERHAGIPAGGENLAA